MSPPQVPKSKSLPLIPFPPLPQNKMYHETWSAFSSKDFITRWYFMFRLLLFACLVGFLEGSMIFLDQKLKNIVSCAYSCFMCILFPGRTLSEFSPWNLSHLPIWSVQSCQWSPPNLENSNSPWLSPHSSRRDSSCIRFPPSSTNAADFYSWNALSAATGSAGSSFLEMSPMLLVRFSRGRA